MTATTAVHIAARGALDLATVPELIAPHRREGPQILPLVVAPQGETLAL